MSNRHRSSKKAAPGASHPAPNKEERRAANRKVRHRTHELLAHTDQELAEEVVPPRPHHTRVDAEPVTDIEEARPGRKREYRHWKQKFWKRRNNERAQRAMMERSDELPLRDVG